MMASPTCPVRHCFIAGAGVQLHGLEFCADEAAAPPLVLLHGVTGHAWLWHDVAQRLASNRCVIAFDLRGHGDSQWSADASYRTDDHIADLQSIADALSLRRFAIAGLSWGGLIAIGYAARHPQRVERLAIIDVEASFSMDHDAVPQRPASFTSMDDVVAFERRANAKAPQALLELFARQSVRPGEQGRWVRKHDPIFLKRWPFRLDDRWSQLPQLHMSTLLLHGAQSFVRAQVMREMAACMPQARFDEIEDCGHLVPLEAPGSLAGRLAHFFKGP